MKNKRSLLVGFILGALTGWAFGFLRLPNIEGNYSFLAGCIACLAVVLSTCVVLFMWNKKSHFFKKETSSTRFTSTQAVIAGIVSLSIVTGVLMICWKYTALENQLLRQNVQIREMTEFINAVKKNDHTVLVSRLLNQAEDEMKSNPAKTLSDETIERMVSTLNHFLPSYRYWNGDTLSDIALSPGRAQLLLGLKAMRIDSVSFLKIKQSASFAGADLRKADLKNFDLRGADLSDADLQDADLSGCDLRATNLSEANLWGANMSSVKMSNANLKRANLSWAQFNEADLTLSNLDGADLTNAQLHNTDLSNATLRWAKASGVMLNDANLENADMVGTDFKKANLSGARLSGANLGKTNLSEVNLQGAQLSKTVVEEKNWLEKLNEWRVIAADEIQEKYIIENDSTKRYKDSKFCLKKK